MELIQYGFMKVRGKGLLNAIVISPEFSATEVGGQFLDGVTSLQVLDGVASLQFLDGVASLQFLDGVASLQF